MRKILMFLVLIVSINSFGQNPANYQYRVVFERSRGGMFDSALHIPRYNGVPVGLRVGSSTHDGAIAMDTLNGHCYFRWNGAWVRMSNFSELATASRFGVEDAMAGQNRIFTGLNNTYYLALDSLNYFRVDRDGVTRMYMDNTSTLLASPDNSRTLQIFNASTRLTGLAVGPGEKQLRIVPGTGIITYADTSTGGGTTFVDNTWIMNDNVDATKQLQFQLSGISPSNIRTLTIPDASGVVALSNVSNNWADGIGQSFNPNGTTAGINVGGHSSDPSALADGDLWYNFSSNELKARINGASVALGAGGGTPTLQQVLTAGSTLTTNNTIITGANDFGITGNNSFSLSASPSTATYEVGYGGTEYNLDGINGTLNLLIAGTSYLTVDQNTTIHNFGKVTANIPYVLIDEPNDRITLNSAVVKMQEMAAPGTPASGYSYIYIKSDGKLYSKDDAGVETDYSAGGGGGTVTSVSFTDGNGFNGTVANPTTTPAISLAIDNPSFEPWYEVYSNFAFSDQPLFRLSNFGAGSTIGTLNGSTIFDGWQFGLYMETGTTTTGSAYSYGYSSGQIAGIAISNSFRYNVGGLVRVEDLSDGTETYNYSLGFGDDWGNGVSAIVDGVYFEYTHSLNSGNWTCTTESNGTKTQTDSGIPVAADTDYTLEVSVLGGNAFFYINKTLVATNTTNIPTGTARATTIGHAIAKSAGTTNRKAYVEWFAYGKRAN